MSLYSFDFFSSFWSFLYWYITYILYLIINYSKHYLWSNTKLYFQSPSFPVIDFHRKEGTRGSFVLGPGRLAGKYRDDGLGWKSSKLQTWVPSGNNWEIRHVEKSTQTPIPTRNTKQLPSQWWLRYQFTCTPTGTRLTEGPGKSLREIHYCRSRIFCIFFTIYIDIFIYYIYLFFLFHFIFSKHYLWSNTKLYFQSPSFPVMDFHTGEGGWSGKFCFGSGQVGRKNPGDGLPHQGGRVLGGIADVADTCLIW